MRIKNKPCVNLILLFGFILVMLTSCTAVTENQRAQLLYHQDAQAERVAGSVEALKLAIRNGREIRVYMNLGAVEHVMDGGFISIFNDQVYAQVQAIKGQRPNRDTGLMELREGEHIGFYSTLSPYEIKWFAL